jgi:hypothetical protein
MIHRHYLHELDVRHELPEDFSFDGEVEAASRGLRHLRVAQTRRAWRVIRRWKAHGLRVPRRGYTGLRMDPLFGSLLAGWHVGRGGQKLPATCISPVWATRATSLWPRGRSNLQVFCPLSSVGRALPW